MNIHICTHLHAYFDYENLVLQRHWHPNKTSSSISIALKTLFYIVYRKDILVNVI